MTDALTLVDKLRFQDYDQAVKIRAKQKLLDKSDEIVDAVMAGVNRGDPQMTKLAMTYSMGTPSKQRDVLNIPELENAPPLQKMRIINNLVATSHLTIEEGKSLSQMVSVELESAQIQTITTFLKRLETEPVHLVAKEMLPALRLLDSPSEPLSEPNVAAIDPVIEELLK